MLDLRIYRAAFVPAVLALFVVAFSLRDAPSPSTTRVAPDAFDADRAMGTKAFDDSLRGMAADFPSRPPGSSADTALADRVARALIRPTDDSRFGFARPQALRRVEIDGDTPLGRRTMRVVMARREGLSSRTIVVLAHRDGRGAPARAELSGTAALLELARVLADRELRRSIVLASVSGGTGGFAGAREVARLIDEPVEAVLVLGDVAGTLSRRPWVVPWSASGAPAPAGLRRTVESALRRETGADPGRLSGFAQWARRTVPITVSEQGVVNGAGLPAVLVSSSGELGPRPETRTDKGRFRRFGRGVLRALTALEQAEDRLPPGAARGDLDDRESGTGIQLGDRLLPHWAVRMLVLALLLPALLAAIDGFFRLRRRRMPAGRWVLWAASWGLPFLLVWAWLRLLDLVNLAEALPAPGPPGAARLDAPETVALASVPIVLAFGFWALRRPVVRALQPLGPPPEGGGAAGIGVLLSIGTLIVWLPNPYAAGVLLVAAHAWLLVAAPEANLRGVARPAAVVAGLVLPLLMFLHYVLALDLSLAEVARLVFDLVGGGEVSPLDALALSLFFGALCAVVAVLVSRRRVEDQAPPEQIVTRGPRSYAGPGSLGGTESALRR